MSELDLPYSKGTIRRAILEDVKASWNPQHFQIMQASYVALESFIAPLEFEIVKAHETGINRVSDATKRGDQNLQEIVRQVDESLAGSYMRIMQEIGERQHRRLSELRRLVESGGEIAAGDFVN